MSNKVRFLYLTGGLGNQLFQYAYALSNLGNRRLVVDSDLGWPVTGKNNLPSLFEFKLNESVTILPKYKVNKIIRKLGFFCIKLSSTKNKAYKAFLRPIAIPIVTVVFGIHYKIKLKLQISKGVGFNEIADHLGNEFTIGYFQSFYWPSLSEVKNQLLNLELSEPSMEIIQYQNLALADTPLVVHIRLGDYLAEKTFGIPSAEYYEAAISELFKQEKHKRIWVFTNDQSLAEVLIPSRYRDIVRWIPNVGDSAAETLEVMRLGQDYVIGNSTYSWWGAFLSKNRDASVIAPYPWFQQSSEPNLLCPPNWKRLEAWPAHR